MFISTCRDAVDAYAADPRYDEEVSDSSDIEFNFDAPLQRVFTAGRSNSSKLNTSGIWWYTCRELYTCYVIKLQTTDS